MNIIFVSVLIGQALLFLGVYPKGSNIIQMQQVHSLKSSTQITHLGNSITHPDSYNYLHG